MAAQPNISKHCTQCGYDIRATTTRCPECGNTDFEIKTEPIPYDGCISLFLIGATIWWTFSTLDARTAPSVWWHVVVYTLLAFGFMTGLSAFRQGSRLNRLLGTAGATVHGVVLMTIFIQLLINLIQP